MEDVFRRPGQRAGAIEEEKRVDSVGDHKEEIAVKEPVLTDWEGSSMGPDNSRASSSGIKKEQDDQLESARAEMGEVREENERLKIKTRRTLQTHLMIMTKKSKETELVSLSLGRFSSDSKKEEKTKTSSSGKEDDQKIKEGLSLGLECKFEVSKPDANEALPDPSLTNGFEEPKEEAGETWPPSKALKTMRSGEEDISQQNPVKRARVSVRARCETPTMNDGCQWRKYGQKIAKGNPCPRAYYRCTVAPSCPVRKQEPTTTHFQCQQPLWLPQLLQPLPCYCLAHHRALGPGSTAPSTSITAANNNLHGLNFYLTDNLKSKQFYLPHPSLSSTPSCPTITVDLTTAPSSSSSPLGRFITNYPSTAPRYSSTSLSFGSSESNSMSWGNNLLSYGSTQPYIKNQTGNTIAAATKAITADPSFQSALVAALTSIIGTGDSGGTIGASQVGGGQVGGGDNLGVMQKLKWGEQFPVASSYSESVKGNGCGSSYLNKSSTTTNTQPGSLIFLPPSLPFASSKSASASPAENREHTN
ncbi:hypothetical protein Patl1_17838 [Pistacia atlantica]|uniref:Uncharacterized protein n=1 Tax=Pistacia atlantica TaxID=434234 RepID=A0ACC1BZX9_9ROSI|nr:hypothetical protein Patl1_17838 [Pistacia atlantica]